MRFLAAGNATAVVAFPELEIDLAHLPIAYLPGIIQCAMELAADRSTCIANFLDSLGFATSRAGHTLTATRSDCSLRVELDGDDRIVQIKAALG